MADDEENSNSNQFTSYVGSSINAILGQVIKDEQGYLSRYEKYKNVISASSTNLAGTASELGLKIDIISRELENLSGNQTQEEIKNKLIEVTKEVDSIKEMVIPKLEETKKTLDSVDKFLKDNSSFLINLLSAEGKLQAIQGEINSIMGRLDNLEKGKERNWQRITTVISLLIAIGACIIAIIF
ncbi:MAG: hypothetical protein ACYDH2_07215 [Anaerolineaceae bacterium]